MNETTKIILAGIIGIIVGAGGAMASIRTGGTTDTQHAMPDGTNMKGEMSGMMQGLDGKSGDAFDKAFLSEMILHHQGAVQMAQAALKQAKHQELKDLAQKIITAQNAEIKQMQGWQASWYAASQPVVTKPPVPTPGKCYVGGCSSQLCTDQKDAVSTCEYTAAYGCYKSATCARQSDGKCGWTPTAELQACLANAR
jgi:hypothetical protein